MKTAITLFAVLFLFNISNAQVRKLGEVRDSNGEPTVFSIDPNNQYIIVGNNIGILTVYDLNSNEELYKVRPHAEKITHLGFYPSANEVVTATDSEIIFSQLSDGAQVSNIKVFRDIDLVKIDPASNQLYLLARQNAEETQPKQVFKVDLKSRKFEPIFAGVGVDDIDVTGDYVLISKGTKINFFNPNLNIVEKTLKSNESGVKLDFNASQSEWLVSHDKLIVRFWKISSERNYELRWDGTSGVEAVDRIDKALVLNEEGKLLFYGEEGLKIRDIKKTNGDVIIQSASGGKIEDVSLSTDRSRILFQVYPNTIEVWNASENSGPAETTTAVVQPSSPTISVASTDEQIYQKYKTEIDKELGLHSDLFAPRGEFERSADYEKRLAEADKFKKGVFDYYKGVENRDNEVALEIERARLKIIADRKREDSLRKVALYKDKIESSYEEFYTRISSVGTYDPDKELFPITIDEMTEIIRVPFDQARDFKAGYLYYKVVGAKQLLQDGVTEERFNYRIITDKGKVYDFGKQRKPLFVGDEYKLFDAATSRNVSAAKTQVSPEPEVANPQSDNAVDQAIFNYFEKKKYHALLIGVNEYADTRITQLDGPINDAQRLKDVISNDYTFEEENITFLKNPTRTEIIETFDRLQREIGENDNLLVFYAGHGIWDESLKQGFWLPSDSKVDSKAAWLSNAMIRDYIGGINSKHTLLVADACFSGGIFKSREVFVQNRASLELAKLPSRKAITSGAMKTVPDQSVFIEYLIKRLTQNEYSLLPTEQLFTSFKIAVMNNSAGQVPQYGDIQGAGDEGGDFVFVKRD